MHLPTAEIDTLYAWIKRNPDKMMLVRNSAELMQAVKQHKLASMIGVEGGHMMEDDLNKLDSLYAHGTRYMTLTWNNNTSWATSAKYEPIHRSLHEKA
jgi:membrane dipeptidase